MARRLEGRLGKLERRQQLETGGVTIVVVEDEDFFGNAHLLAREAAVGDGQAVGSDEGTTSDSVGGAYNETA